jgi:hypothetical protein
MSFLMASGASSESCADVVCSQVSAALQVHRAPPKPAWKKPQVRIRPNDVCIFSCRLLRGAIRRSAVQPSTSVQVQRDVQASVGDRDWPTLGENAGKQGRKDRKNGVSSHSSGAQVCFASQGTKRRSRKLQLRECVHACFPSKLSCTRCTSSVNRSISFDMANRSQSVSSAHSRMSNCSLTDSVLV